MSIRSGPRRLWRAMCAVALCALCARGVAAGIVDVAEDARFDRSVVQIGLHRPDEFSDGGIYMVAPADPAKEVVLFIHGANGSPRDFIEVARHLDTSKQQAWFAYYASGNSITATGRLLANDVAAMMTRYGITQLRIFAHSVGGLVAWELIADLEGRITVLQLISVNTPWNGSVAARLGKWFSPSPLALWVDLSPGSKALLAIRRHPLATSFTLVYTVTSNDPSSAGDGTVTKASQTAAVMEQRAVEVIEAVGTHSSALHGALAGRMSDLLARGV